MSSFENALILLVLFETNNTWEVGRLFVSVLTYKLNSSSIQYFVKNLGDTGNFVHIGPVLSQWKNLFRNRNYFDLKI